MVVHIVAVLALVQGAADTLTVAEAVRLARAANPSLAAARLMADAAAERVGPAGALPDPELTLGLVNRPLYGFGVTEPMTMNVVGVSQVVPWPARLGAQRDRARRLAAAGSFDADETEATLVRRVEAAHHDLAFVDRSLSVMERTSGLLRQFEEVARVRYAVGDGLQQDVLRAQVAVGQMTQEIVAMQAERRATAARLNTLLGRDATVPIAALSFVTPHADLPDMDSLLALAVRQRPALAAADERVRAAAAAERAARAELLPDLMLSVSYGQRPRFDDMVSLMVGISLPLWAGSRALPMRRETAAIRAGAEADALALRNETYAELTELHAAAVRAHALMELYDDDILPQARAAVASALAAYRVGRVEFATLLENEMAVNTYEIARLRFDVHYHHALAGIEALTGFMGGH
jgi:outer membrane protein TolC